MDLGIELEENECFYKSLLVSKTNCNIYIALTVRGLHCADLCIFCGLLELTAEETLEFIWIQSGPKHGSDSRTVSVRPYLPSHTVGKSIRTYHFI